MTALKALQPTRQEVDVFPTHYRLNTERDLKAYFPPERFRHCGYAHSGPPAYFGSGVAINRAVRCVSRWTPERLYPVLFVFMQKTAVRAPGRVRASG
ncbi:MAG: hypothetical protein LC808_30365 [Actinobacteria bacterium]|nr:hypothetical protein [Actinomycetota bacterium]